MEHASLDGQGYPPSCHEILWETPFRLSLLFAVSFSALSNILSLIFYSVSALLSWTLFPTLYSPSLPLLHPYNSAPSLAVFHHTFLCFSISLSPQEMQIGSSLSIRNAFLMSNKWINTTKALGVCVASMCMWETVWACLCEALGEARILKWYNLGCFQPCTHKQSTQTVTQIRKRVLL